MFQPLEPRDAARRRSSASTSRALPEPASRARRATRYEPRARPRRGRRRGLPRPGASSDELARPRSRRTELGAAVGGNRECLRARDSAEQPAARAARARGRAAAPGRGRRAGRYEQAAGFVKADVRGRRSRREAPMPARRRRRARAATGETCHPAALARARSDAAPAARVGRPDAPPVVVPARRQRRTAAVSAGSRRSAWRAASACSRPTCAATAAPTGSRRGRSPRTSHDVLETLDDAGRRARDVGRTLASAAGSSSSSRRSPRAHRARGAARPGDPAPAARRLRLRRARAQASTVCVAGGRDRGTACRSATPTPREFVEEDVREHLVRATRTARSAAATAAAPVVTGLRRAVHAATRRRRPCASRRSSCTPVEFGLVREDQLEDYATRPRRPASKSSRCPAGTSSTGTRTRRPPACRALPRGVLK